MHAVIRSRPSSNGFSSNTNVGNPPFLCEFGALATWGAQRPFARKSRLKADFRLSILQPKFVWLQRVARGGACRFRDAKPLQREQCFMLSGVGRGRPQTYRDERFDRHPCTGLCWVTASLANRTRPSERRRRTKKKCFGLIRHITPTCSVPPVFRRRCGGQQQRKKTRPEPHSRTEVSITDPSLTRKRKGIKKIVVRLLFYYFPPPWATVCITSPPLSERHANVLRTLSQS